MKKLFFILLSVLMIIGLISCTPGTSDISGSGDNTSEDVAPDSSTSIIDETTIGLEDLTFEHLLFAFTNEHLSKLSIDMINTENISQETLDTYFKDFNDCFENELVYISTYEQMVTVVEKMVLYKSIDLGIVIPDKGNDDDVRYYKFYLAVSNGPGLLGLPYVTKGIPFMFAVPVDAQGNPV